MTIKTLQSSAFLRRQLRAFYRPDVAQEEKRPKQKQVRGKEVPGASLGPRSEQKDSGRALLKKWKTISGNAEATSERARERKRDEWKEGRYTERGREGGRKEIKSEKVR